MKIIKLTVENFKGISVVEIEPKTNMVKICGQNGAGKSSVIDSIEAVFRSGHYMPDLPVRLGAEDASIIATIGDGTDTIIIEKVIFPDKKVKLKVTKNGTKYSKPQELLDDLCSGVSFDPFEFLSLKPNARVEMLKQALKIDFSDLDVELDKLKAERLVKFQTKQGAIHNLKKFENVHEVILPNISEVREQLDEAKEWNAHLDEQLASAQKKLNQLEIDRSKVEFHTNRISQNVKTIDTKKIQIETLLKEIAALEVESATLETQSVEFKSKYELSRQETENEMLSIKALDRMDIKPLQKQIDDYLITEAQNVKFKMKGEAEAEARSAEADWAEAESKVNAIYNLKKEIIGKTTMPIEGMLFEDDTITINGVPLEQVNTATQMHLSIDIAMRVNPKLKVIRVKNGSLLDNSKMALLEKIAIENDFQCWVEEIRSIKSNDNSFFIEEGVIA